jgi:hypothetical protein
LSLTTIVTMGVRSVLHERAGRLGEGHCLNRLRTLATERNWIAREQFGAPFTCGNTQIADALYEKSIDDGYTSRLSAEPEAWMPWKESSVMEERLRFVARCLRSRMRAAPVSTIESMVMC